MNLTYSIEKLIHFNCPLCLKWWSIGDAPIDTRKIWYCPWCGCSSEIEID